MSDKEPSKPGACRKTSPLASSPPSTLTVIEQVDLLESYEEEAATAFAQRFHSTPEGMQRSPELAYGFELMKRKYHTRLWASPDRLSSPPNPDHLDFAFLSTLDAWNGDFLSENEYRYWLGRQAWTLNEASYLLCGFPPPPGHHLEYVVTIAEPRWNMMGIVPALQELIQRAAAVGNLPVHTRHGTEYVDPLVCAKWFCRLVKEIGAHTLFRFAKTFPKDVLLAIQQDDKDKPPKDQSVAPSWWPSHVHRPAKWGDVMLANGEEEDMLRVRVRWGKSFQVSAESLGMAKNRGRTPKAEFVFLRDVLEGGPISPDDLRRSPVGLRQNVNRVNKALSVAFGIAEDAIANHQTAAREWLKKHPKERPPEDMQAGQYICRFNRESDCPR